MPSDFKEEVFTLLNARSCLVAESFPHVCNLHVYLVCYFDDVGDFSGNVKVGNASTGRMVRYARFDLSFDGLQPFIAVRVELDGLVFPNPGGYLVEVRFFDEELTGFPRADALIQVHQEEDES